MHARGREVAPGASLILENLADHLAPKRVATRFPDANGNETAANGRTTGRTGDANARDRLARTLAAVERHVANAFRARSARAIAAKHSGLRAAAPGAPAV